MKKSKSIKTTIIIGLVIALLLVGGAGFYFYSMYTDSQANNNLLTQTISENTQTVYVATRLINKGEKLIAEGEEANVEQQMIYTGIEAYNYMPPESLGSIAVVPIDEGIPVLSTFVASDLITADEREYEVAVVNLATTQNDFDFVDIRICFPNGEDYLVLPKRQIKNLNLETCTFTIQVNEEELLRFNSSIIDAFLVSGTRLYTTKYIEDNLQEEAVPTYLVRTETLDVLNSDPNVLTKAVETLNAQARLSMEQRMGDLTEEELSAVTEGWNISDSAKSSVLLNGSTGTGEPMLDEDGNVIEPEADESEATDEEEETDSTDTKETTKKTNNKPSTKKTVEE